MGPVTMTAEGSDPESVAWDEQPQRNSTARGDVDSSAIKVTLSLSTDIVSVLETVEDAFGPDAVRSVYRSSHTGGCLDMTSLTADQRTVLRVAYYNGYFETPRESSAPEVAEILGVSPEVFHRLLRTAQAKVFSTEFD